MELRPLSPPHQSTSVLSDLFPLQFLVLLLVLLIVAQLPKILRADCAFVKFVYKLRVRNYTISQADIYMYLRHQEDRLRVRHSDH